MPWPTVSFATSCWERDWRWILLQKDYLAQHQIARHCFPFAERLLVINNVQDMTAVKRAAEAQVDAGILTRYVVAEEKILPHFQLKRQDFGIEQQVSADWVFYNALAPLAAIYESRSEYLLYLTGDTYLEQPIDWIRPALRWMEKDPMIKVANLTWNGQYREAKKEAYRTTWNFYQAKEGFSDQVFLVRGRDFRQAIYAELRPDAAHFPRGDVFEKRVFSYMKNHGWERITFRRGSYTHKNIIYRNEFGI